MNIVMLTGRVGRDPEYHTFASGDRVANLQLATRRLKRNTQTNALEEVPDWHRVRIYGPGEGGVVERVQKLVRRGGLISVRGELVYEQITRADGTKHTLAHIQVRGQDAFDFHVAGKDGVQASNTGAESTSPSDTPEDLGLGFDDDE